MLQEFFSHYYPKSFSYGGGLKPNADLPPPGRAWVTEVTEAAAWCDLVHAAPPELGFRFERVRQAYLFQLPGLPHVLFNRVVGLGLVESASEAVVDEIIRRYRDAGIEHFAVQLSPEAVPELLDEWLVARGLQRGDEWTKLYRRPARGLAVPETPRIELIGPESAAQFAAVVIAGYGMPDHLQPWLASTVGRIGWQHYLAYDGEQPIAAAALFCRSGTGWLGMDTTLPAFRNQGAQSALIARRIRDGGLLGCQWLVTETEADRPDRPSISRRNMVHAEFGPAYERRNYIAGP